MANKFAVFRIIRTGSGASLSFPLKLYDNEEAAKQFVIRLNEELGTALGMIPGHPGLQLAARTPAGPVFTGQSLKEMLVHLFAGNFGLDHVVVTMPEHSTNLEVVRSGLVDPTGRPV